MYVTNVLRVTGDAGDLRHGEEHRVAEEDDRRQGGADAGGADPTGDTHAPSERRGVPGPRPTQVGRVSGLMVGSSSSRVAD